MWDERSFDIRSFDERSWLFLFETPYADLSHHERIYVRTVLESAYSLDVAEQIVAVAAVNRISVLDAAQSLAIRIVPMELAITQMLAVSTVQATEDSVAIRSKQPVPPITVADQSLPIYVTPSFVASIVETKASSHVVVSSKPGRIDINCDYDKTVIVSELL